MPTLDIMHYPNTILTAKSAPVKNIDDEIIALSSAMVSLMYKASGIGLAAPQVGVLKKLLVIDLGAQKKKGAAVTIINPQITEINDSEISDEEGCLSIPGIYANVVRQKALEVKGTDIDEKEIVLELDGLLARAIQHEIDHCNGVLFWDHLGKIKRDILKRKFKKLEKQEELKSAGLY